jgi:hypothetical protein
MKEYLDYLLHKLAETELRLERTILDKIKQLGVAPAFKPVEIYKFTHPRPHMMWYLRRNEKKITDWTVLAMTALTFFFFLIKIWR